MAQTGYTPIQIYSSSTPTNAPSAGNLTNDTKGSELAINIADKNLFFKDSSNVVNTVPIRQSGAASDGWLSSTDWNTFNNKQPAGAYLTAVTADAPLSGAGTSASHLVIAQATTSTSGYLSSTDWNTFNSKQAALVSGTNIKTVNGTTLLGSGDLGTITTAYGGTGLSSWTAGDLPYYSAGTALSKLGIGAANTVLTSSGSAPQWTAQNALSVGTAANLLSNATTGVMQIVGPAAASTRVMTIPNANFTAARTDAAQTFTGVQTVSVNNQSDGIVISGNDNNNVKLRMVNSGGGGEEFQIQVGQQGASNSQFVVRCNTTSKNIAFFNSNGDVAVNNGNLVIGTSGKGIDFSATSGTGTSELLNDYEEGTWTPAASTASGSVTASNQGSLYVKVGQFVCAYGYLNVSSVSSPSGTLTITGLPFTSQAQYGAVALSFFSGGLTTAVDGYCGGSSTSIIVTNFNSNTIGAGANIMFTAMYRASA